MIKFSKGLLIKIIIQKLQNVNFVRQPSDYSNLEKIGILNNLSDIIHF